MKIQLLIIFMLFIICSYGQVQHFSSSFLKEKIINRQTKSALKGDDSREKDIKINDFYKRDTIAQMSSDSACYMRIIKRDGWFQGIEPKLTLEESSHLNCYFKLSRKNTSGKWTFMQAYNGYGKLTPYHSIGTYLANQWDDQDKGLNKDWKEKLQQVCQWEFIGNAKGDEVIQERGLDSKGNIMFVYNPVKINDSTYVGSYTDAWGMPIFMRTDSTGNDFGYANFVQIVRDTSGHEVLFKFVDRNGIPKKNRDGGYMTKMVYDNAGNQTMEASLGITGKEMIDDYGNCGWRNTYDSLGNRIFAKYYDAEWNPIRLPGSRGSEQVYGYCFKYDEYGREIERGFLDNYGNRDINQFGSFRIGQEYNNHGLQKRYVSYDRSGNKIAFDSLGTAEIINEIDSNGYYLLSETKDAKGNYVNNASGICKKTWTFKDNIETSETEYEVLDDSICVKYAYNKDSLGNERHIWYNDNLIRIVSVDEKKREVSNAYYDLEFQPKELWGYHKRITTYHYDKSTLVQTREWYDKSGNWAIEEYENGSNNGYTSEELFIDSIRFTEEKKQYLNGKIKQCFAQIYDPNFSKIITQYDITPYGEHSRIGWWDNLHYNAIVNYDLRGNFLSFIGTNEFDEPGYLSSISDNLIYHYLNFNYGNNIYYDEDGKTIPTDSMANFRNKLPKAFCIEVIDTALAYPLGIRNGDIILSYGDWHTSNDCKSNLDYFFLEAILKNKETKQMTVLRHHPQDKTSKILTFQLGEGTPSELGFYTHQIYYTRKEKERLLNYANANSFKFDNNSHIYGHQIILGYPIKGSYSEKDYYWSTSFKDPFVVLSCGKHPQFVKRHKVWSWRNDFFSKWIEAIISDKNFCGEKICYSTDFILFKEDKWHGSDDLKVFSVVVNDIIYDKMMKLYKDWSDHKSK